MKMNNKFLRIIILSILISLACLISLQALTWSQIGWQVKSETQNDDGYNAEFSDSLGAQIFVKAAKKPSEKQINRMFEIYKNIKLWKSLTAQSFRFVVSDGLIETLIVPKRFMGSDGKDFMPYLPSGLSFSYADTLQYAFRMKIRNLFVRIRGQYSKETELTNKMSEAIENPHAYIRKRDPEYFLKQLKKLDKGLLELRKQNTALKNQVEYYRRGYMALLNEGFFSGPKLVDETKVQKILELKKQNPKLTKDQVKEALDKQKVEISSKELTIIFMVFFHEVK